MSELVPVPRVAAVSAERGRRSGLPNLECHLKPERLAKQHREAITKAVICSSNFYNLRDPYHREPARRQLESIPSVGVLIHVAEGLGAAMDAPPDRRVTQAAVAVLFDSRVRGPQNPEIYLDALVFDLCDEGFPPAVVVAACQHLRRESKFTPEISEVIATCREKASSYRALARVAARLCEDRNELERQITAAEVASEPAYVEAPDWDPGELD